MTYTITATFTNNPTISDTKLFADSHRVSFKKLSKQTFVFSTDNKNIAAEVAEQLHSVNPILSFDPNF